MIDPVALYHRLPYALKVAAASARGFQLRRWRYGADTERLIGEALDRESWTAAAWASWRAARLEHVLHRAATRVPYYRDYWADQRRRGNRASPAYLEHWPLLAKQVVREHPTAFVADDRDPRRMYVDHSSGTTGRPTLIYVAHDAVIRWYALLEARLRRWHGVSYRERWAMFGGQRIAALARTQPPFWVHNHGLHQLYCSIFHISRDTARAYVAALHAYAPTHMIVFPSALSVLAYHMLDQGLAAPRLRVILCNSEKVRPEQRRLIERAFGCPVIETYGMAEVSAAASQCPHGTFHDWPEVGIVERYDRARDRVLADGTGELALTGLFNDDMPLVRYLNGDLGTPPVASTCACGRTLPRLGALDGRSNDLLVTPDGRELYLLDSLFNGLPIVEAQLVQHAPDRFTARVVPGREFAHAPVAAAIERALAAYIRAPIHVDLVEVAAIARTATGKLVPYVSELHQRSTER